MPKKKTESNKPKKVTDDEENRRVENKIQYKNGNLLDCVVKQERISTAWKQSCFEKGLKSTVIENVKKFAVCKTSSPFDKRITALAWHPKLHNMLAVGSKAGDIIIWNLNQRIHHIYVKGSGPGGSVTALKFDEERVNSLYTSSLDGTVCRRDLESNTNITVYLDTGLNSIQNWYTCLDVQNFGGLLAAGDNKGYVNLLTKNGDLVWKKQLHKEKVHHIEFHTLQPQIFVTASVDSFVRLWDVRCIKDSNNYVTNLKHDIGVSAAYFSRCHGTRIVTTDQSHKINIFSGPLWDLETTIIHPHRRFQHLTSIKAHWHPLEDIIVVGRYPDPKLPKYVSTETRSVDFFDANTGKLLHQLEPKGESGIISLNQFNGIGNVLASSMGRKILLWKQNELEGNKSSKDVNDDSSDIQHNRPSPDSDESLKKRKKSSKVNSETKKT